MNKILIIIGIVTIIALGVFVSAEEGIDITISNNTLTVEGYSKNADFGKFKAGFVQDVSDVLGTSLNCETLNLTVVNETNSSHTFSKVFETNCLPVLDYSKEIAFDFNVSEGNQDYCLSDNELLRDYIACEEEKATYKIGYTTCTSDNFDKSGLESNLTKCDTDLQICRSERASAEADKTRIETDTEDKKNQRWIFGVAGVIAGVLGTLWQSGRIGGPKVKKPEDSYNPSAAG